MTRPALPPVLAVAAVIAVVVIVLILVGATATIPPAGDPPLGAALSEQERRDLHAAPVRRGADPPPVDPTVDPTDPLAVARAYLETARTLTGTDAGATQRRAAAYAVPGSPPAVVGLLVLDEPPPGTVRTARLRELTLLAATDDGRRRGYRAVVETATGLPGGPTTSGLLASHLVLARQPDGRWLVSADQPENPDLPAGEDLTEEHPS